MSRLSACETLQGSVFSDDTASLSKPSEKATQSSGVQSAKASLWACVPDTRWTICLVALTFLQLVLCVVFETQMYRIAVGYRRAAHADKNNGYVYTLLLSQVITVTVEVCYQLLLALNAIRVRNIVRAIGLCLNDFGILLFVVLAGVGVEQSIREASVHHDPREFRIYAGLLLATLLICTVALAFIAWKLSAQFAWAIYRHMASGSLTDRRRYLMYEIYIALLHLDFFFLLGFWLQSWATMNLARIVQLGFIVILPITPFQLLLAAVSVRREWRNASLWSATLLLAQCAAILVCLIAMYTCEYIQVPPPARQRTLAYAVTALPTLTATVVMTIVCVRNFGHGLKARLRRGQVASDVDCTNRSRPSVHTTEGGRGGLSTTPSPRMLID